MTDALAQSRPSVFVGPGGADVSGQNAVLTGRATQFRCETHPEALSMKLVTSGTARWKTTDADLVVRDDAYLILGAEQRYTVTIDSRRPVETLTVWFRPGFVEGALHALTTPAERLLDEPPEVVAPAPHFFERLRRQDDAVGSALVALREGILARRLSSAAIEDRFYGVAALLGELQRGAVAAATRLSALRASTRAELIRRLFRARDFMASSFHAPMSTEDMARAACLSTHHFHRLFSEAFEETPHQFLVRRRLDRARRLLTSTDLPVGDICFEVGMVSQGSFSSLFRRSFGVSPRQYRAAAAAR